jgi:hypothetical protein
VNFTNHNVRNARFDLHAPSSQRHALFTENGPRLESVKGSLVCQVSLVCLRGLNALVPQVSAGEGVFRAPLPEATHSVMDLKDHINLSVAVEEGFTEKSPRLKSVRLAYLTALRGTSYSF